MRQRKEFVGKGHIINCHTHIFTGDFVPPFLAKTFLPWLIYRMLTVSFVIKLFRFWYNKPDRWQYKSWFRRMKAFFYWLNMIVARNYILIIITSLITLFLTLQVFFILVDWLSAIRPPEVISGHSFQVIKLWLKDIGLIQIPNTVYGKILLILLLFVFFKNGRNFLWFILKKLWFFLDIIPGPKSRALIQRYLNLGRFAFYKQQLRIFSRLKNQYPENTGFVVLPMDMKYMGAGSLKNGNSYELQMKSLAAIKRRNNYKNIFLPLVFVDPRRMQDEGDNYFKYSIQGGKVSLEDCFIKEYIEDNKFSGFKIYPALGYYVFHELLLPLLKYAADNKLPVVTHCSKGPIYYRGKKKNEWDHHPIFEQACGNDKYEPLLLSERKNINFTANFSNPLNYLCVLEEQLLRKVIAMQKSDNLNDLFGFKDLDTPLKHSMNHLKLCFGHFGGDDEWTRYIESDRDNYSSQLLTNPHKGISFLTNSAGQIRQGKLEQVWKYVDWYSIICSIILQYSNVYGDLSYILHKIEMHSLIKSTLKNPKLRTKILFGTDFYVIRNHKSEKKMLAEIMCCFSEEEFDQIARINPKIFLTTS